MTFSSVHDSERLQFFLIKILGNWFPTMQLIMLYMMWLNNVTIPDSLWPFKTPGYNKKITTRISTEILITTFYPLYYIGFHEINSFDQFIIVFIRPFEKRDVLCRGNVRPSVCPSVCPSVRPSVRVFRTFLQHALRYQFETWYMHSVGGTTCRVWVASQLGQFDLVYSQK